MIWRKATYHDFEQVITMSHNIAGEIESVFEVNRRVGEYHLINDLTSQQFKPSTALILVHETNNKIDAFTWARVETMLWSNDAMLSMRIVEVAPELSLRIKFKLLREMMAQWEQYCCEYNVPIICSSTVRQEQQGFLRLHRELGYVQRGCWNYKRVIPKLNATAKFA